MTTWIDYSRSNTGLAEVDFLFSDGADFLFSDSSDYVFLEGTSQTVWNEASKSAPTWSFVNQS
jgi:hypothetical protein